MLIDTEGTEVSPGFKDGRAESLKIGFKREVRRYNIK